MRNNVEPKFKININNDELLEAIWEHIKQMKREGGGSVAFCLVWNFAQDYTHDHNNDKNVTIKAHFMKFER
jgi:hypothetical protein